MFLWFYVGWFACVFMARAQSDIFSLIFPAVGWFLMSKVYPLSARRLYILSGLTIVGLIFDSGMGWFGLIRFEPEALFAPLWLVSIWLLFASLLPLTKEAFGDRLLLSAFLGAIFGPLSYLSGEAFGVLFFSHPSTVWIFSLFWALYFPAALLLQKESR